MIIKCIASCTNKILPTILIILLWIRVFCINVINNIYILFYGYYILYFMDIFNSHPDSSIELILNIM